MGEAYPVVPQAMERAIVHQRCISPADSEVLSRLWAYIETTRPTLGEIKRAVCEHYQITSRELTGDSRRANLVLARHVFCYLAYRHTQHSMPGIARWMGYCDHTPALHAINRIVVYLTNNPGIVADLELLRERIAEKMARRPWLKG